MSHLLWFSIHSIFFFIVDVQKFLMEMFLQSNLMNIKIQNQSLKYRVSRTHLETKCKVHGICSMMVTFSELPVFHVQDHCQGTIFSENFPCVRHCTKCWENRDEGNILLLQLLSVSGERPYGLQVPCLGYSKVLGTLLFPDIKALDKL